MRLIERLTILALFSLIISLIIRATVGGGETGSAAQIGVRLPAKVSPSSQERISILSFDARSLPGEIRYQGRIVMGARWMDSNGENFLLLTQTGKFPTKGKVATDHGKPFDAEVYGYNYVKKDGAVSLLWKLTDFERECPFDLYAGFLKNSLVITDLDSNGVAESSFLYKLSCRSDVSPATLKLMMREGAKKFAIRGTTKVPGDGGGGEMNIDPAFKSASPLFRNFAVEHWKKFVVEKEFEQL